MGQKKIQIERILRINKHFPYHLTLKSTVFSHICKHQNKAMPQIKVKALAIILRFRLGDKSRRST